MGIRNTEAFLVLAQALERYAQPKAALRYSNLLRNARVQSWKTHNRMIVAMTETQQAFMIVIFGLMGIISVLVVFVFFYMIISHKSKDIGVLKTVGVSNREVLALFLIVGLLVGISGSLLGALAGWQFIVNSEHIEGWFTEYLGLGHGEGSGIESRLSVGVLAVTIVSAISACLLGALIPSWQAARMEPVETLQVTQL